MTEVLFESMCIYDHELGPRTYISYRSDTVNSNAVYMKK